MLKGDLGGRNCRGDRTVRNLKLNALLARGVGYTNGNAARLANLTKGAVNIGVIRAGVEGKTLRKRAVNNLKFPIVARATVQISPQIEVIDALSHISCGNDCSAIAYPLQGKKLVDVSKHGSSGIGAIQIADRKITALTKTNTILIVGRCYNGGVEISFKIAVARSYMNGTCQVYSAAFTKLKRADKLSRYTIFIGTAAVIDNDGNIGSRVFHIQGRNALKLGFVSSTVKINAYRNVVAILGANTTVWRTVKIDLVGNVSTAQSCKECSRSTVVLAKIHVVGKCITRITILKRGDNVNIDRSAIQIEPCVNTRKRLGNITFDIEYTARLGCYVQILGAVLILYQNTVSI